MIGVTVKDVAALAGVSTATVSRVLSETGTVRPATRQRVLNAAEQLGYQPSSLPRTMRRKRSQSFGVVVSDIENPFYTAVIRGCEREAHELGFRLTLVNSDEDDEKEEAALRALAADRVAGVILASSGGGHLGMLALKSVGVPVVAIDNNLPNAQVDLVTINNVDMARRATEHLMELGHERIVMISGPETASSVAERDWGFKQAVAMHGPTRDRSRIVRGDLREETALARSLEVLRSPDPPTAFFTVNNMSTLGLLRAVHESGLKAPTDLSIVGFDDIPLGSILDPPLTVVVQPTDEMGRTATQLLVWRMDNPEASPVHKVLRASFLERASVARPPTPPRRKESEAR